MDTTGYYVLYSEVILSLEVETNRKATVFDIKVCPLLRSFSIVFFIRSFHYRGFYCVRMYYCRSEDSLMAVIPDISCMDRVHTTDESLRVPLVLVRMDGVIYPTGMSFSYSKSSEVNGYAAMAVVPDCRLSDEECETAVISSPVHYPHSTPLSPHYITSPSSSSLSSVTSPGLECPPLPFRSNDPTVNREPLSSFPLLSSGHHHQPPQLLPQSHYTHQHHHTHTHHR
jgi:hypothetical protein